MAHLVKCIWCGKQFDTEVEQAVKITGKRRYGHLDCQPSDDTNEYELAPLKEQPDPTFIMIKDFINEKIGDHANWPLLIKELKNIKERNNFSYSGILKTLTYYYEIKKKSIPKNYNLLAIVPYWYKISYDYYYNLYLISQQAEELEKQEVEIKEVSIPIPRFQKKKKMFNLEDDE